MRRSIAIIIALIIIGIAIVFAMFRGGRESTVKKTDVVAAGDTVDSTGKVKPAMDELLGVYSVDSKEGNAELLFNIDGLKSTTGAFEKFNVELNIPDDFTKSALKVEIDAASLNTENTMRDEHLLEPDFFDVKKFPKITYTANSITYADSNYICSGDMQLLSLKKALSFDFDYVGGKDEDQRRIEVFEGEFVFDRTNYGMEESSGIGNDVTITFYVELEKDTNK